MCNCSSTGFNPFNMLWMLGQSGSTQASCSTSVFPGQSQGQTDPFMMMMMAMMMSQACQQGEKEKKMNAGRAIDTVLEHFTDVDNATNTKDNNLFGKANLETIIENKGDYPKELVKAAKYLLGQEELLKELGDLNNDDKTSQFISKGDVKQFKKDHPYLFEKDADHCNNDNTGWNMPPFMLAMMQMFGFCNN